MRITAILNDHIYVKEGKTVIKINALTKTISVVSISELEDLLFHGNMFYDQRVDTLDEAIEYYWYRQSRNRVIA